MTDAELYGETSTPEQDRSRKAKHLRTQVQKIMDAFYTLRQHGAHEITQLVFDGAAAEAWYSLFAPQAVICMVTLEDLRDAVSTPDPRVRPLWSISTEPFYTVPQAIRALMDATLELRRYRPELAMNSLGAEQHARFMAEVEINVLTLELLASKYAIVQDALYGDPAPPDAA